MNSPTKAEFIEIFFPKKDKDSQGKDLIIVRGKVVDFFPNGEPKIQFAGEDTPRDKIYSRLSENIELGDTVFLIKAFNSWLYWKDCTKNYNTR